ncbi:siphovirus Gp157 family protein [Stutzerimonas kunmingensis]|uniref:siphovirus Gp157 family protein n=1 Tax=Stutzerimonas kunmingensis TaxID=1211807 RepID=UPI001E148734|nr:siphovirus Gp157 family protein [Stutzerimonas kunmingensis]MBU2049858.1 siphovirus Gp157 family protein [Gammaproteobacteria bacterium]
MSALYEITGQFKELATLQETADEDLAVAIRDTMAGIEAEFNDKALAASHVILNFDADVAALDKEIERLQERKRLVTNRQREIKEYLRENMEACGMTKISCPLFTITLAKGRESVVVDDENSIPDDLMRVKTEIAPDKTAIAAKLKAGEEVPGARLERGQSSIRIK